MTPPLQTARRLAVAAVLALPLAACNGGGHARVAVEGSPAAAPIASNPTHPSPPLTASTAPTGAVTRRHHHPRASAAPLATRSRAAATPSATPVTRPATAAPATTSTAPRPRRTPTATASPSPSRAATTPAACAPTGRTVALAMTGTATYAFSPSTLSVRCGDGVTVTNKSTADHTWDANPGPFHSGDVAPGRSYTYVFRHTGSYSFYCSIHPYMTGRISVS